MGAEATIDRFLEVFTPFRASSIDLARQLCAVAREERFAAGTTLYRQGDACPGVAFVLDGELRVYTKAESGREITLYEIGPGETCVLNASCILSGGSYPVFAAAVTDGRLLMVPSEAFRRLMNEHEFLRRFIFDLFGQRLIEVMELVQEVAFRRMDERLMEYLVEKSTDGVLAVTHQQIAADLGTSREVVSRLLKEFERRGRVRLSRHRIELLS